MSSSYKLTPTDRVERAAARLMARLSPRTVRLLAGRPVVVDGQTLDPQIQLVLKVGERRGLGAWKARGAEGTRREARRSALVTARPLPRVAAVDDLTVPGPAGPLPARRYTPPGPSGDGPRPALVFFHGGGLVFGDLDSHDKLCRMLCFHAQVTVVAIDYRLAPENPFPAAVEDAHRGLRVGGARGTPRPTGRPGPRRRRRRQRGRQPRRPSSASSRAPRAGRPRPSSC